MASPFPGMDPYLEGDLWPDVHHALASQIRRQLMPLIQPKYVARISRYVVEDTAPESEIGIMYPDVEVLLGKNKDRAQEPSVVYTGGKTPTPAAFSVPLVGPIEVQIPVVEIRDTTGNRLITAIEILSPVNKRMPGLEPYLQKWRKLHQSGVHLLEIDLLRRGTRPVRDVKLQDSDYLIVLTRGGASFSDLWPLGLRDVLPVVPVPLSAPDEDVVLDLQQALRDAFEDAAYHLSIDYTAEPPAPKLMETDVEWIKGMKN